MAHMKGIILAGGNGTRLYPITIGVSKQLLPVYDKPLIYYPLSVLMIAEIREILIITRPEDLGAFKKTLGDGSQFGIKLSYEIQNRPEGIAQAFIIGEKFIGKSSVCLILGDNIFYGMGLKKCLMKAKQKKCGGTILAYQVKDPERFGVVEFDKNGKAISLEEKPSVPNSKYAVTGIYFYDNEVVKVARIIKPSARGELEITDINKTYMNNNNLSVVELGRGFAWLDTGTHSSLMEAGHFIQTIENRQGLKIACLEEIAFRNQWITLESMINRGLHLKNTEYGDYLVLVAKDIQRILEET